ncbi:nitroreductase family protein [Campylobacter lari]
MQDYLNLMQNRSSIRAYTQEKISKENLEYILECARLSPSSLGLEPWKFLVFQKDEHKKEYAKEQSYLAIANIINAAYSLNLGSCIIGGFDKDKINQYLNLDTTKQRVSMLITLGYTQENISTEKARFTFDEVVEFKD